MGFHPLVLCRKFAIQHMEEGYVWIDGLSCRALLLQPGADYLRVCLHAGLLVRDDKHLIWDEVESVLRSLALEVAEVHDSTHVHIPEVVPASTWQHLQRGDGDVGGGATLSEPVGGVADGAWRGDMKERESQERRCNPHDGCVRKGPGWLNIWLRPSSSSSDVVYHVAEQEEQVRIGYLFIAKTELTN